MLDDAYKAVTMSCKTHFSSLVLGSVSSLHKDGALTVLSCRFSQNSSRSSVRSAYLQSLLMLLKTTWTDSINVVGSRRNTSRSLPVSHYTWQQVLSYLSQSDPTECCSLGCQVLTNDSYTGSMTSITVQKIGCQINSQHLTMPAHSALPPRGMQDQVVMVAAAKAGHQIPDPLTELDDRWQWQLVGDNGSRWRCNSGI